MSGSITNIIRTLFLGLDTAVYWLVDQAYYIFSLLTEVSIFTQDQIEAFASRIYVLISIIMLFKLGFSFITYIVNPDSITDKQKGGVALLKKIVIAIVLLVSVPTIFNEAFHVQQLIFKNNVIDRILLGDTSTRDDDVDQSKALSTYAFLSFFRPEPTIPGCSTFEGLSISEECVSALNAADDSLHNPGTAYKMALNTLNISYVLNSEIVNTTGTMVKAGADDFYMTDVSYLFSYHYLISTIFGGVLAWILIGFCFDLAIRAIKIGFLQIIAPIPIILSLSPQQKNNTLANWGKECLSTWASLFIRILVISFAINAVILINSGGGVFSMVTGGMNFHPIVAVFVMLGLLLFAKEFPKLLEDILGIKGAGKLTFNPWKKLGSTPLVGGLAAAGLTAAGGGLLALGRGAFGLSKGLLTASGANGRDDYKEKFREGWGDTGDRLRARRDAIGSSAKEKLTSAGLKGTDKLGGSMHKSYKENFRGKDYDETEKQLKSGEKLLRKTMTGDEIDPNKKYDIYGSKEFSDKVKEMDTAKDRRNEIQDVHNQMRTQIDAGMDNIMIRDKDGTVVQTITRDEAVAQVDKIKIDADKAESDYNKIKVEFDKEKVIHKKDASKYDAYTVAADAYEASHKVSNYQAGSYAAALKNSSSQIVDQHGAPIHSSGASSTSTSQNRPSQITDENGNPIHSGGTSTTPPNNTSQPASQTTTNQSKPNFKASRQVDQNNRNNN